MVYVAVCGFSLMPCLAVLVELFLLNGQRSLHIHESNIQHKTCPARYYGHVSSSYWLCPVVATRRGTVIILCFYLCITYLLMPPALPAQYLALQAFPWLLLRTITLGSLHKHNSCLIQISFQVSQIFCNLVYAILRVCIASPAFSQ